MKSPLPILALSVALLGACSDKEKTKATIAGDAESPAISQEIAPENKVVPYEDLGWKKNLYTHEDAPYTGKAEKREGEALLASYTIREGQFDGPTREYYPSGQIKVSTNFKEGKRNGPNIYYNEDGSTLKSQIYEMDVLVKSSDPTELPQ
ncbi:MAG: hypothetical protein AAGJ79_05835 [Verrucomicrobiota bacterium]